MNSNIQKRTHLVLYVLAVFGAAAAIYSICLALFGNVLPTAYAQQDPFLSQRLNRIEQRFTLIESRLNQLEQQSRFPATMPDVTANRDAELSVLRNQLTTLQLRMAETECNLLRLDERTLSAAAKEYRKKSGMEENDVCRQTPNVPLKISVRP